MSLKVTYGREALQPLAYQTSKLCHYVSKLICNYTFRKFLQTLKRRCLGVLFISEIIRNLWEKSGLPFWYIGISSDGESILTTVAKKPTRRLLVPLSRVDEIGNIKGGYMVVTKPALFFI